MAYGLRNASPAFTCRGYLGFHTEDTTPGERDQSFSLRLVSAGFLEHKKP